MKKILFPMIDSKWVLLAVLVFWSVVGAVYYRPASDWFQVESVVVSDSVVGEGIPMAVMRTIKQEFYGTWQITIRRRSEVGWYVVCSVPGSSTYLPDASMPPDLDLDWWTENGCPPLKPGSYIMNTRWSFEPGILPRKYVVSANSNIFKVNELP